MGSFLSRALLPSAETLANQLWEIAILKIKRRVAPKTTSNEAEIVVDMPSSLVPVFEDKIKHAMNTNNSVPMEQTVYDMYYLTAPEIDNLLPFHATTRFLNIFGKQLNTRKDIELFAEELNDDEPDTNRYEKIILYQKYCHIFDEQLKQASIKCEIAETRAAKRKRNPLPTRVSPKNNNIKPASAIIIEDMAIGFDVRSPGHQKMGKMKIVLNSNKYHIKNDKVSGQSNILVDYYDLDDSEIAKELAAHPLYNPKYKKKSYKKMIKENKMLNKQIQKTKALQRKLNGLRADPAFLYFPCNK